MWRAGAQGAGAQTFVRDSTLQPMVPLPTALLLPNQCPPLLPPFMVLTCSCSVASSASRQRPSRRSMRRMGPTRSHAWCGRRSCTSGWVVGGSGTGGGARRAHQPASLRWIHCCLTTHPVPLTAPASCVARRPAPSRPSKFVDAVTPAGRRGQGDAQAHRGHHERRGADARSCGVAPAGKRRSAGASAALLPCAKRLVPSASLGGAPAPARHLK